MSCCSGVSFFRNKNNKSILQFYRKGTWLKCRTYKIENCVTYNIPIFLEKDGLEPIRFRGFIRFHCLNSSINFLLWDRSNKQISLSTRNTRMVIKRRVMSRNRLHWTEKRLKMPENWSFNNIIIRTPFSSLNLWILFLCLLHTVVAWKNRVPLSPRRAPFGLEAKT